MEPVALITGITGQDGQYLARLLLEKGYHVHGFTQAATNFPHEQVFLHRVDLKVTENLHDLLKQIQPCEVYHMAAQSHVPLSYQQPLETAEITGMGALRMLEAVRQYEIECSRQVRFFQASSSAILDDQAGPVLNEQSPIHPRSPYACAKAYAHLQVQNYREAHGMFACNGILFNHESPLRDESFVTRKITRAATRIKLGLQQKLILGNLDAERSWGYAGDFVQAMWLMLQLDEPDDFVISTTKTHSVREFVDVVFQCLDLDYQQYVEIDPEFFRPHDAPVLCGDITRAQTQLGWQPQVSFTELAHQMTQHDLELAEIESRTNHSG
ncbi:GDP-mannose 4,6-dehydratase [Polystyrenella longa]|uniref:GDP-mannose 4,6-dehydratase n=1 Tax=Polystyrenella longa TaxID=2528007 RepID=A0A518CSN4_9PLAN|nr:GDP-mannose 4,6-dehydratase [Polystyrenella longa]QDU82225.1 GDP-mannose 4,6-dehydratase [Polystyrenella longa]